MSKKLRDLTELLSIAEQKRELQAGNFTTSYKEKKMQALEKEASDIIKSIESHLLKLTPREHKIFNLRFVEGKDCKEIAKELKYSVYTIQHKLAKINKKLSL